MFSSNSINRNTVGAAIAGAVSLGCGCKAVSSIAQGLYKHWSLQNNVLQCVQSVAQTINNYRELNPLKQLLPIPSTFSAAKELIKTGPSIFSWYDPHWFRAGANSMLIEGAVFSGLAVGTALIAYKLFKRNTPPAQLAPSSNEQPATR